METILLKKKLQEKLGDYDQIKSDSPVELQIQIQIPQPGVFQPQVMGDLNKVQKKKSLALLEKVKLNPGYLKEVSTMNRYKAYLDAQTAYVQKFMI